MDDQLECSQDHNADTDGALADIAHRLASILERRTVAIIGTDFLFFGPLLYTA